MCDLTETCPDKKVTGYKIVARKKSSGKFYSLAMGFQYRTDRDVPRVKEQRRLSGGFRDDILDPHTRHGIRITPFRDNMVGRTAIFESYSDAKYQLPDHQVPKEYEICLVRVALTGDLLVGTYQGSKVIAGRRILSMRRLAQKGRKK